jgi:hypothetical protein
VTAVNATLRRSIATAAVALAVPVLSACGSNFDAPTDQVYTPGIGVNDRSGSVDVLHALIVSGEDGSGTVIAGLVNNDEQNADALTDVAGAGDDRAITVTVEGAPIEVPAGQLHQLADEGNVTVTGDQIQPGRFVELSFSFERGQTVEVEVPVVNADHADFGDVPLPGDAASS